MKVGFAVIGLGCDAVDIAVVLCAFEFCYAVVYEMWVVVSSN